MGEQWDITYAAAWAIAGLVASIAWAVVQR
jgi:hypothetical protein